MKLFVSASLVLGIAWWAASSGVSRSGSTVVLTAPNEGATVRDDHSDLISVGSVPARKEAVQEPGTTSACVSPSEQSHANVRLRRCVVHLVVPASVCVFGEVSVCAEAATLYARYGDDRFLEDWIESESFDWDPFEPPDQRIHRIEHLDDTRVQIELVLEFDVDDVPIGAPLWVVAWDWDYVERRVTPCFAPVMVALPPDGAWDTPVEVQIEIAPLGAVRGKVVGAVDGEPHTFEARTRDLVTGLQGTHHDHGFTLWPLADGRHVIEVFVDADGRAHRFIVVVDVRAGCTLDLGELWIESTTEVIEIDAISECGSPLRGKLELRLDGWPVRTVDHFDRVVLQGDWSDLEEVRFVPSPSDEYSPVALPIDLSCTPRKLTLVAPRRTVTPRSFIVVALAPDGQSISSAAAAFVRRTNGDRWRHVYLGYLSYDFMRPNEIPSCRFEPGHYELVAWMPEYGLSYVGPLEVPIHSQRKGDDRRTIELPFVRSGTRIHGNVRGTCRGVEVDWQVDLTVRVRGELTWQARKVEMPTFRYHSESERRVFDVRGLPANVDLELVIEDQRHGRLVVPFRLSRGEQLDLGQLLVKHD